MSLISPPLQPSGLSQPANQPFTVILDQFEGPLDLLLYLIQSQELDISKVSISKVTDQYLTSIQAYQELNFDLASDFLVMAATLIVWKSKAVLPQEPTPPGAQEESLLPLTEEELVARLQERQRYLASADALLKRDHLGIEIFHRQNRRPPVEKIWKEMSVSALATSLQDVLIREQRRSRVVMKKETVSLSERIEKFISLLPLHQVTELRALVGDETQRGEWVVSFLASLELARLKKLKIYQELAFDPIFIELINNVMEADIDLGAGFAYVTATEGAK